MITPLMLFVLAFASVPVCRAFNGAAIWLVRFADRTPLRIAVPREPEPRAWRAAGGIAPAVVLIACWQVGPVAAQIVRPLP
jgi:hypothetical protein